MGSRWQPLRLDFRTTSTSSGTNWLRGATFLHRFGGSIFRRAIARQKPDHWGFRRSRTGLPRKSSSGTWSPSWNRSSMKAPMDIDRAGRRLTQFGRPVSDAGGTTGCSMSTCGVTSTALIGTAPEGGPQTYGLPMGASLHRTLVEGSSTDGGWQDRAAYGGNSPGRGGKSLPCKSVPALRLRHVDGAGVSRHSVREVGGLAW